MHWLRTEEGREFLSDSSVGEESTCMQICTHSCWQTLEKGTANHPVFLPGELRHISRSKRAEKKLGAGHFLEREEEVLLAWVVKGNMGLPGCLGDAPTWSPGTMLHRNLGQTESATWESHG